jgi:hypothetical protein
MFVVTLCESEVDVPPPWPGSILECHMSKRTVTEHGYKPEFSKRVFPLYDVAWGSIGEHLNQRGCLLTETTREPSVSTPFHRTALPVCILFSSFFVLMLQQDA